MAVPDELRKLQETLDERTVAEYRRLKAFYLAELEKIDSVLSALGATEGAPPILPGILAFLKEKGTPQTQYAIIAAVGKIRAEADPSLLHPYNHVWKSLRYHDAHNGEIVCVEWKGKKLVRAKLKQRPPQLRGGKHADRPEDYREENLFWFRDKISTTQQD